MPDKIVTAKAEIFLLGQFGVGCMALVIFYIVIGVIYESFHKADCAANLLLGK